MATIDEYMESAEFIKEKIGSFRPEIALVLGSGLGYVGDEVEEAVIVPYHEIPHFPVSTAPGHKGQLVFGKLEGKNVAAMQGRFHYYEGYSLQEVSWAIRVLRLLGCEKVILTNAAGCINRDWHAGELMLITDHIKFFLDSPLRGENIEEFGFSPDRQRKNWRSNCGKVFISSSRDLSTRLRQRSVQHPFWEGMPLV